MCYASGVVAVCIGNVRVGQEDFFPDDGAEGGKEAGLCGLSVGGQFGENVAGREVWREGQMSTKGKRKGRSSYVSGRPQKYGGS